MHEQVEKVLGGRYSNEPYRIFVIEGFDKARLRHLAVRVMDIYAQVTGAEYTDSMRNERPDNIVKDLEEYGHFEYRFGMPMLDFPACTHGKLRGRSGHLYLPDERLRTAIFYADTNDGDALNPSPVKSIALARDFNVQVTTLADTEYADTSVPAPIDRFYQATLMLAS